MTSSTGRDSRAALRAVALSLLVLVIGIPASWLLFVFVEDSVERVAREANAANGIIEDRLLSYTHVLYGLRALFTSEDPVSRRRFHRFVETLDIKNRYPGFISLNYAAHVPNRDRKRFEESVRLDTSLVASGYPNFSIKPAGERSEYFVIVYLEPMAGYEFAFGLDLGANPMAADPGKVAATVLEQRDTGNLISSAQPLRVKRDKEAIYLAMRLAVYRESMPLETVEQRRNAYIGSVGAGFDVESLVRSALNEEMLRSIRLRIFDAGPVTARIGSSNSGERRLLFDSNLPPKQTLAQSTAIDSSNAFIHVVPVEIASRHWKFEYSAPRGSVIRDTGKLLPAVTLGVGIVTTLLIFGMVYVLATSRSRAIVLANEITQDLRESESSLAEAQQMAHLGNWTIEPGTWNMTLSAEINQILGRQPEFTFVSYDEFLKNIARDERGTVDRELRQSINLNLDCELEHRVIRVDGAERWVHTIAHPSRRDRIGVVPGTIMDITDRKHAELELKESHEQLQALSRSLVDIQEAERRRFSTELHDVVGQNLTALSINLDIIRTQYSADMDQKIEMRLNDSVALLRSTTAAIENVMAELRPPMLDDYGLISALQWYAKQFSDRTGIHIEVHGDETIDRMTSVAEIALFRVAQEALNNVAKHARATSVDITFARDECQYVMSVADDGSGLDVTALSAPRKRSGLGMITMRERMQAIGGSMEVQGSRGFGTSITLRVPA
jgi:signal transduction histidine kinase